MAIGAHLIQRERDRQVMCEGWTAEHDDEHTAGEMAQAACCYADPNGADFHSEYDRPPEDWPWDPEWWKPTGDRVRDLVKAGALIAAEIDRLLRTRT